MPLLTGRWLIRMTTVSTSAPNDLYAFTMGMHVCGVVAVAGYLAITKRDRIQSKASDVLVNTKEYLPRLYQTVKHVGGLVYLFTAVFVVLPFAASLLTELYVHMPIYSYFVNNFSEGLSTKSATATVTVSSTSMNPTIFVLQTWTLGLLYMRLALRLAISYPGGQNRPSTALRAIVRHGYLRPDVALASRALVFPALGLCIVLLAAPIGLARIVISVIGTVNPDDKLLFYRYSYPVLLAIAVSVYIAIGIQHKIEGWRVKVRDEVYLVGERLHNFAEPENERKKRKGVKVVDKGKVRATVVGGSSDEIRGSGILEEDVIVGRHFLEQEHGDDAVGFATGSSAR